MGSGPKIKCLVKPASGDMNKEILSNYQHLFGYMYSCFSFPQSPSIETLSCYSNQSEIPIFYTNQELLQL